jgi:phosphatidylinositol-3-phosphatase
VTPPTDDQSRAQSGSGEKSDARACRGCGAPISGRRDQCLECRFMPSPWAAAVAVMGMLTLGVLLGSASSQVAQSAGLSSIVLEASPAAPAAEEPVVAAAPEPEAAPEPAPSLPAATSSLPIAPPPAAEPAPAAAPEPPPPPEFFEEEEEALPPVKHVFMIVLGENSFEEAFGATSPAPYLARTLAAKGELLPNYYAVTKGELANQIALLSGQGPTVETAAGCPGPTDILPGTASATGQVEGAGCVYPAATATLPGQLAEKKLSWKAYVEDRVAPCVREEGSRDPLTYFHSLTDGPECARTDVGLERLAADLKLAAKMPALSYIVPDSCHDGGELPCAEGAPVGPVEAEPFLRQVIPEIEASPAYKEAGLIAITSAQARQSGPTPDAGSCCVYPVYPNLPPEAAVAAPPGPVKPSGGGGRVGLLLLSPFVAPGTVDETGYFNHFSLLRSIEELFELEPIGYAGEEALTGFDGTVYSYEASSSSASCRDCASRVPSADQSSPSSSKNPWRAVLDLKATR